MHILLVRHNVDMAVDGGGKIYQGLVRFMISKKTWLAQFEQKDMPFAVHMLEKVHRVSANEFSKVMERLVISEYQKHDEPTALFVEREVKKGRGGKPTRLFKEQSVRNGKRVSLRATGAGPAVLHSQRGDRSDVGSEGLLASIGGQLGRVAGLNLVANPSPNLIRKKKIRHFFIITDLIGSGDRIWNYLQSAWLVRSIKSWRSRKLLQFTVLAYAATTEGVKRVKSHPCGPNVVFARKCPTIFSECKPAGSVMKLCKKYYHGTKDPMGYNSTGALIIFKHGCPNNVPPLFHEAHRNWKPLFDGRSGVFGFDAITPAFDGLDFSTYLDAMGYPDLGRKRVFTGLSESGKRLALLMCAIKKGITRIETLCSTTGLPISEIADLRKIAIKQKLLASNFRLTDLGLGTLESILEAEEAEMLPKKEETYYYPKQLRLPFQSI